MVMGIKVVLMYVILVLGFFEEKMYVEIYEIFGDDFVNYIKN